MTLQECFEKAGSKFPFKITRMPWKKPCFWIIETRLSNGNWVGVNDNDYGVSSEDIGRHDNNWELVETEKPRVFRWEKRMTDFWTEIPMFFTKKLATSYFGRDNYRKSRLHGTVYPIDGWEDT